MKFTLALAAFVAAVYGQTVDDIPSCAIPCLDDAIENDTTCAVTDYACACQNFDQLEVDAAPCIIDACGEDVAISTYIS